MSHHPPPSGEGSTLNPLTPLKGRLSFRQKSGSGLSGFLSLGSSPTHQPSVPAPAAILPSVSSTSSSSSSPAALSQPAPPSSSSPSASTPPVLPSLDAATNRDVLNASKLRMFFPLPTLHNYPPKIPTVPQFLSELHLPQRSYVLSGENLRVYLILTPPSQCLGEENLKNLEKFIETLTVKAQTVIQRVSSVNTLTKHTSVLTMSETHRFHLQTYSVRQPGDQGLEERKIFRCGNSYVFPVSLCIDHFMNMVHEFNHLLEVRLTVEHRQGNHRFETANEESDFATFESTTAAPVHSFMNYNNLASSMRKLDSVVFGRTITKPLFLFCPIKLTMQHRATNSNHAIISFEVENLSNATRRKDKKIDRIKRRLVLEERMEDSPVDEDQLVTALSFDTPPLLSPSLSRQLNLATSGGLADSSEVSLFELGPQKGSAPASKVSHALLRDDTVSSPSLSGQLDPLELALASRKTLTDEQETSFDLEVEKIQLQFIKTREGPLSSMNIEDSFGIRAENICPVKVAAGEMVSFLFGITVLTDHIPKEFLEQNTQYHFKLILSWKMTSLSHQVTYDYLHPIEIPTVFQQRVGTEIMLSFHLESSKVVLNEVFQVSIQIVNRSAVPLDLVLRIGDVLNHSFSTASFNTDLLPSDDRPNPIVDPHLTRDAIVPLDSFMELEDLQPASSSFTILRFVGLKTGFHNLPKVHLYDKRATQSIIPIQDPLAVFVVAQDS